MIIRPNQRIGNDEHKAVLWTMDDIGIGEIYTPGTNFAKNPIGYQNAWGNDGARLHGVTSPSKFKNMSIRLTDSGKAYCYRFKPTYGGEYIWVKPGFYLRLYLYPNGTLPAASAYPFCMSQYSSSQLYAIRTSFSSIGNLGIYLKLNSSYYSLSTSPNFNAWNCLELYISSLRTVILSINDETIEHTTTNDINFWQNAIIFNSYYPSGVRRQFPGYIDYIYFKNGIGTSKSALSSNINRPA